MNPDEISVENRVMLSSGDLAEVLAIDAAAFQVQIRYLDAMGDAEMVGSESWVSSDDIIAIDQGGHSEGRT